MGEIQKTRDEEVGIAGIDVNLTNKFFRECLLHDNIYITAAGVMKFFFLWRHSRSLLVTFSAASGVVLSTVTAYCLYTVVYKLKFFPVINLSTVIIITVLSADNALVYCGIWAREKKRGDGRLVDLVRDTLPHAGHSSLVTAAALLFGSCASSITAIRCFGIFAGTAVLANFIFNITCLPASVLLAEKCSMSISLCVPAKELYLNRVRTFLCSSTIFRSLREMNGMFSKFTQDFFEKTLPCIILRFCHIWLALFATIAACGIVLVFYYPKFQLPDSKEFRKFNSQHPFERYDLYLKNLFSFESAAKQDLHGALPLRIVWGVLPKDNGNYLDPSDKGTTEFDDNFNVALPESQVWLLKFCSQLRNQSFYSRGLLGFNCFIEDFKEWMNRRCGDEISDVNRMPCCEISKFPFSEKVFNRCIKLAAARPLLTPSQIKKPFTEGVLFSKRTGKVQGLVIQCDSAYSHSMSHSELYEFRTAVDSWISQMMAHAPKGMKNGWFTSDLDIFNLQERVSKDFMVIFGISIAMSFTTALLFTRCDMIISILILLNESCIVVVTFECLILLGWKLNFLESTMVLTAIGLAADFSMHYFVPFRLSSRENGASSVTFTLSHVGSSVAIAAFTSIMAAALTFPSIMQAVLNIGIFIVNLKFVSWLYSTFFLIPLLHWVGPEKHKMQLLKCPPFDRSETPPILVENNKSALSASTVSSNSGTIFLDQLCTDKSYELESLPSAEPVDNSEKLTQRLISSIN